MSLSSPRRYQLKKEGALAVKQGHPWIYRNKVSTAVETFASGQWLQLVGAQNEVLGFGIFEPEGLIAIRVLKQGDNPPDAAWVRGRIDKALKRRENLRKYTDGFRAVHGENDGLPGIVVDVYNETAVLQTYAASVDRLGRYVAAYVTRQLGLKNTVWKFPVKRKAVAADRVLRGHMPRETSIREGQLNFSIPVGEGQKSGAFLDLRGLRKWIATQKLDGKRVLNLFAYTGTLGFAAEAAKAREIWNVDISKGALDVAKRLHAKDPSRFRWVAADIFDWFPELPREEKFDLLIVDPPMMASKITQVDGALHAYRKLYREAILHVKPKGFLVAACCTARIPRKRFEETVGSVVGERFKKVTSIAPEDDHPVGFSEGDYLKILVFRAN
ncbi:class I SAM-dependent methyltransferase [bacterium]|nr:class I SAM-dependent methyltransferase [bacterium]